MRAFALFFFSFWVIEGLRREGGRSYDPPAFITHVHPPHPPTYDRDQANKGIRVFSFATKGVLGTLHSVFETARLFEPVLTQGVSAAAAARNAEFLRDYAGGWVV